MIRQLRNLFVSIFLFSLGSLAFAQNAQIQGQVSDASGAVIPKALVRAVNQQTGTERKVQTNGSGQYIVPGLDPSVYKIFVQAPGFSTAVSTPITLYVAQTAVLDFKMKVGDAGQTVTVDGSGLQLNTTDASVSTVVDRKFVGDMPLNGRSFQALILLAPGVLTTTPQFSTNPGVNGEFSVNGQRTDANAYTVDGISANNGVAGTGSGAGNSGSLASFSALGTTQPLVSVDALQEFRITTSTSSAEYGRQPGAQIEFQTRSGSNDFHGTAFDYFRNDALDANNWFNDNNTPIISKPAERQNDFGGVLGGPIMVPKVYSGRDRTFFFFSYEGLRLAQPQPAQIIYVPTNGTNNTGIYLDPNLANLRANAPAALRPVLNAFPKPNCTLLENPQCVDYGDGLSPAILSTSLPSRLDSVSVRLDHQATPWLRLFFRYAITTSSAIQSVNTQETSMTYKTQAFTFGGDSTISASTSNQFRLGYSPTRAVNTTDEVTLGGGTPANLNALQGLPSSGNVSQIVLAFPNGENVVTGQGHTGVPQHQWNVTDTLSWSRGRHSFRAGIDYRRTVSYHNLTGLSSYPLTEYVYESGTSVLQNATDLAVVETASEQDPAFTNFSAFVQDNWRVQPRLTLSFGVRWELNPPPSVIGGQQQRTIDGSFSNPATLALAPIGTPLYKTTYYNFAPRLGIATTLHNYAGHETVFRAGGGVYFDTGQQFTFYGGGQSPGLGAQAFYFYSPTTPVSFPLTSSQLNVTPSLTTPYGQMYLTSRNLQLPYSFQWNASLEQALGATQSLTVGYVGSNGRRLLHEHPYDLSSLSQTFTQVFRFENGLSSSYNALQLQYKRTLSRGLQALIAYTWSHAIDYESQDYNVFPYQRASSDNDVRNNFTTAISYDLPRHPGNSWQQSLFGNWGMDLRLAIRTAFPVELQGPQMTDSIGNQYFGLLNYSGGNPYIYKSGIPGGRQFNANLFSVPSDGQIGNTPRNFLRGFGENEVNLAVRRDFPIYEGLHLQFRVEAFNLFNHPNFGQIDGTCGAYSPGQTCTNPLFGQATGTLATSLGGGLTQLYQQGGPRSLQLALKMVF